MSKRAIFIAIVGVTLLGSLTLASLLPSTFPSIYKAAGMSRSIALVGYAFPGWNDTSPVANPTITVVQGDVVNLTLSSGDLQTHRFDIDVNGSGVGFSTNCLPSPDKCSNQFPPDPVNYIFTVDFPAGTYQYYCTYHPGAMLGSFVVQGFTLSSSPASLRVAQGSTNTSTITLTSVNNFAGAVNLTNSTSPSGPDPSLNQTSANLVAGGTKRVTLTVSAPSGTLPGSYTVTVRGTSGSASNAVDVSVTVIGSDFTITASPSSLKIAEGGSSSLTVTVTSISGFSGSVGLTIVTFPSVPVVSPTTSTIQLTPNDSRSLVLNVTIPTGLYLATTPDFYGVNITGTSGPLSHSVKVPITVSSRLPSGGISPLLLPVAVAVVAPATFLVTLYLAKRRRTSKPSAATVTPS